MLQDVNVVDLLTAAGVLLANYWLYRLDTKFNHLKGRVDGRLNEQGDLLQEHVNAPGLHSNAR